MRQRDARRLQRRRRRRQQIRAARLRPHHAAAAMATAATADFTNVVAMRASFESTENLPQHHHLHRGIDDGRNRRAERQAGKAHHAHEHDVEHDVGDRPRRRWR